MVVTTSGPRKPHRQASNAFSTASNELYRSNQDVRSYYNCSNTELHHTHYQLHHHSTNHMSSDSNGAYGSMDSRPNLSQSNIQTSTTNSSSIPPQQSACLETSFTNLNSPQTSHRTAHFPESVSSSKASSLAGSVLSRSQISCIQCDISSSNLDCSVTTVTRKSPNKIEQNELILHPPTGKPKCVAFEDVPSPSIGNLKLQHSEKREKRPKSLVIPPLRRASDVTSDAGRKDGTEIEETWGLAPLASPETLSEISSISSRNSVRNSFTTSIDHYLQNIAKNSKINNMVDINDVFESQLRTPTVLRRAPKFSENLANCAEDKRYVDQYKRIGRVVVHPPLFASTTQDSSEEEDSFESATSFRRDSCSTTNNSLRKSSKSHIVVSQATKQTVSASSLYGHRRKNSKSADQLDEVLLAANKQQTDTSSAVNKLNFSDSNIINDNDINNCDKVYCTECSSDSHSSHLSTHNTGSQETTFYSANSSIDFISVTTTSHKNNTNCHILPEGVLESHFPLLQNAFTNTKDLNTKHLVAYNNDHHHHQQQDHQSFTVGLKTSLSSPLGGGRGKRKNCIYPSSMSAQALYTTTVVTGDNAKLLTNNTTTINTNVNNTTRTIIPELTNANGSSTTPSPRQRTLNESSV